MTKIKTYFTLCARDDDKALWGAQFGDYEAEVVENEMEDLADAGTYKNKNMKIIETTDQQPDIDAAVRRLNYPNSARAFR